MTVAVAILCKTPEPGKSKTRLSPPLKPEECAGISACFITDLARTIASLVDEGGVTGYAVYTPIGSEAALRALLPDAFEILPQRGDGFGERLLHGTSDLLARHEGAILVNSDSPTLPLAILRAAVAAVKARDQVVLSPAHDGGYTLIGLSRLHARLFDDIPWSTAAVHRLTVERAAEIGIPVVDVPGWYDVDDDASLKMLEHEFSGRRLPFADGVGADAPATRRFLATPRGGMSGRSGFVSVVIPCLNEAEAIGNVVREVLAEQVDEVIVVDNGSTDDTSGRAAAAGARVVVQAERGYGRACAAGLAAVSERAEIVCFLDGDGSDVPAFMAAIVGPVARREADFVMGSRLRGRREPGSMTPQQIVAGRIAGRLIRLAYGVRYTDMSPFRAARVDQLRALRMGEMTYGWNLEMQMKAAAGGLRVLEVPVDHRLRRGGVSKVSGDLAAGLKAAWVITRTFVRLAASLRSQASLSPTEP